MDAGPPHKSVMIRHARAARRRYTWDALQVLEVVRPCFARWGSDPAASMIPGLETDLYGPKVPWLLSARFKGESWIHCIGSNEGLVSVDQLGRSKDLQVLAAWFDPRDNRTHTRFYKSGDVAASLTTEGPQGTTRRDERKS